MKLPTKIGALTVSGTNPDYNDPKYLYISESVAKELRPWQLRCFLQLFSERFAFIAAFCGSGKSILLVALSIDDIIRSGWKQKQLIIVPQSHINDGFSRSGECSYIPLMLEGVKYEWQINHNFCDGTKVAILAELKEWLLTDPQKLAKKRHEEKQ